MSYTGCYFSAFDTYNNVKLIHFLLMHASLGIRTSVKYLVHIN